MDVDMRNEKKKDSSQKDEYDSSSCLAVDSDQTLKCEKDSRNELNISWQSFESESDKIKTHESTLGLEVCEDESGNDKKQNTPKPIDESTFFNLLDLRQKSPVKMNTSVKTGSEELARIIDSDQGVRIMEEAGLILNVETGEDNLPVKTPECKKDHVDGVAVAKSLNSSTSSGDRDDVATDSTRMAPSRHRPRKTKPRKAQETDDGVKEEKKGKLEECLEPGISAGTSGSETEDEEYNVNKDSDLDEDSDSDSEEDESDQMDLSDEEASPHPPALHIVEGSLRQSTSAVPVSLEKLDYTAMKDQKRDLSCHYTGCKEKFEKQCQLINHERNHSGLPPLKCRYCKDDGKTEFAVNIHLCQFCGKAFNDVRNLRQHVKTHSNVQRYECELCEKKFKNRSSLTRHNRIHTGEEPYECMFCARGFRDYRTWKNHERSHTGERPYKCEYCGKDFRQSKNLKAHINSAHTAAEQYTCEICGKVTLRKDCLYSHMLTHKPKSKERPYKCDFKGCVKAFRTKDLLRSHNLVHCEKKHKCDYCDKTFAKSGQKTVHHRTHTNEKPYICEFCDKSFRTKTQKDQHINIHTGEKPFKCKLCDKSFAATSTLRNHGKMHQKELSVHDALKSEKANAVKSGE